MRCEIEKRGTPNQTSGLIGVFKNGKKYTALINYGGTQYYLGTFDTKEQAGMAYDRFVVDKSTEEVSFTLNYPNDLPTSGTNKDGTNDPDPPTTIKQDPEAELIFHKKPKKFMSKLNPKQNFKSYLQQKQPFYAHAPRVGKKELFSTH